MARLLALALGVLFAWVLLEGGDNLFQALRTLAGPSPLQATGTAA